MKILAWPAAETRERNPYNALLCDALAAQHEEVLPFTASNLVFRRWHIFHLHWPESPLAGLGRARNLLWLAAFLFAIVKSRLSGARIVWTVHNIWPHVRPGRRNYRRLLHFLVPRVDGLVVMNSRTLDMLCEEFPELASKIAVIPSRQIPHMRMPLRSRSSVTESARMAYVVVPGAISSYKGLERVAEVARAAPDLHFVILGRVLDPEHARVLGKLFEPFENVEFRPGHVSSAVFEDAVAGASAVLLPYRAVHNSGAAVLAASAGKPLLMARSPALQEAIDSMPEGYVLSLDPEDPPSVLADALRGLCKLPKLAPGELERLQRDRCAKNVARAHRDFYRQLRGERSNDI